MKSFLAAFLGLLVAGSSLASANAYPDYSELSARSTTGHLYDRDLSYTDLGARDVLEVSYQPSLRSFLEEAATVHRRAFSDFVGAAADEVEARDKFLRVEVKVDPGVATIPGSVAQNPKPFYVEVHETETGNTIRKLVADELTRQKWSVSEFNLRLKLGRQGVTMDLHKKLKEYPGDLRNIITVGK
ncbi:hypothetical protein DFP72DRAFT_889109 [Ephemerocybe angulata]|uniref:Uncharacterized protein n=1 Tax=Ephemerocybe angulata TaxID=980116 RepID=A0A8H6MA07_9AGAR|nr:hypothetical protein DFP72DRAFT_889109 [Tulosesus angulatus]